MKKLLSLVALLLPISSYALDLIYDFEWLEPGNSIEIAVGESYQLKYNCSNNSQAFTDAYSGSWNHYEFNPSQRVVSNPTGYSIDEKGVIKGLVPGKYAIKCTGWIIAKDPTDKWLDIKVVSERGESEPNNSMNTANTISSKIRFGLYNTTDVDYFKYTNPNLNWGDLVTFKIHYYGNRDNPFGYKWTTFCGGEMVSSGSLISQDQVCKALVISGNTVYLEVYYDQSFSQYYNYGDEFVAEVFINGIPADLFGAKYKLTYMVDGAVYKSYEVGYGSTITPESAPVKEGYTFSGWSEIPATMPANDVTVTGSFKINKYSITYYLENKLFSAAVYEYGAAIVPPNAPVREGYVFEWENLPEYMPAKNLTITGKYVNMFTLTYEVDGSIYKSYEVEYGSTITAEEEPTKEGYTFSGWSEIPGTMPGHNVTVTGSFTINQYLVTFILDGEVIYEQKLNYGTRINAPKVDKILGYRFSGWGEVPETVPAHDVTFTGSHIPNEYTLTYEVDGEVYKTYKIAFGTPLTEEPEPTKEGYTFSGWSKIPETMPAQTVIIRGTFTINWYKIRYYVGDQLIAEDVVKYGTEVTLREYTPKDSNRYTFIGWEGETYETMPAHDIEYHANIADGISQLAGVPNGVEAIYDAAGRKLSNLQRGVNILRMSDGTTRKLVVK